MKNQVREAMNELKDEKKPGKETENKNKKALKENLDNTAETGGPQGPEPTRYGDWERKGRCVDF
jgi:hypothetical protein